MAERGIKTYIPKRKKPVASTNAEKGFEKEKFEYDSGKNIYYCPAGKELNYSGFSKKYRTKRYKAKKKDCMNCPYREQCTGKSGSPRMIERNMHEEARQEQHKNVGTSEYYRLMRLRKIWCEGNFSHQKERHNLRRTRKRGIETVTEQCLLSACALNLKRMVKCLKKTTEAPAQTVSIRAIRILRMALFIFESNFVNSAEMFHSFMEQVHRNCIYLALGYLPFASKMGTTFSWRVGFWNLIFLQQKQY